MIGARVRRVRAFGYWLLTAAAAALALPAVALADEGPARGTPGGGPLAQTGFEAWQVGLAGLLLVAAAFVVLRRTRFNGD